MANPLTIQEFTDLTDPRFYEIMDGVMEKGEDMIPMIYDVIDSDLPTERGSMLTPMGQLQKFTGVGQIGYDGPDQGFDYTATHVEYALGLQIQRRLWRFDQFNLIENMWELLGDSAWETRQVQAAKIFNEGNSDTSLLNFNHTRGEAPFADTHASPRANVSTATGFDNLHSGTLSRTALNTIRIQANKFRDDAGRVRGVPLDCLIIPPDLEPTAEELIQSDLQPDTANNAINTNKDRFEIVVWNKLTDTNDYWVVNKAAMKRNLKWFEADDVEYNRVEDFETFMAKYSVYMQHTTAWADWRFGVGAYNS